MKRCINFYEKKSFLNFIFAGVKFYYKKRWGIYVHKHLPLIFLNKFAPHVKTFEIRNRMTDELLDLVGYDYVGITCNDYVVITYTDGTTKKLYAQCNVLGEYEIYEND